MTETSNNLKRIAIKGFKSIAKLDLPMTNINILIGANGAGKTNLISIFTFLSHLATGKLKNHVWNEGGAERFFHFGTANTDLMTFDLTLGDNGYHVEFSPNLDDDSLVFNNEYCKNPASPESHDFLNLYSGKGESGFVSGIQAENESVAGYVRKCFEKFRVYHFHDTGNRARFKKTNKLVDYHYLEKDAGNIAPFLYHLKTAATDNGNESYRQIVSAIQSVAPFFHDFYLEPGGVQDDENIILRWIPSLPPNHVICL